MTDYEKIRLAIFENADISNDERQDLLILAEERENDNADYVKNANKVYLASYKEAAMDCQKDIKEAKALIKSGDYSKASSKLKEAKKDLNDLDKVIDNTPSTLTSTAISQCVVIMKNALISYAVSSVIDAALKDKKKDVARTANTFIDNTTMSKDAKDMAKGAVKKKLTEKPNLADSIVDEISWQVIKTGFKMATGKRSASDINQFKTMAKTRIKKELAMITKLEIKLNRLK